VGAAGIAVSTLAIVVEKNGHELAAACAVMR